MYLALFLLITFVCAVFCKGIHIVRPAQRGLVELFGRYRRLAEPGFHWVMPLIGTLRIVNVAGQLLDTGLQLVITSDAISVVAEASVYLRVRPDEESVKAALYNTDSYLEQTLSLSRTALMDIIGRMPLRRISVERAYIGVELRRLLAVGTAGWGLEITRAELRDIEIPREVQEALNKLCSARFLRDTESDKICNII